MQKKISAILVLIYVTLHIIYSPFSLNGTQLTSKQKTTNNPNLSEKISFSELKFAEPIDFVRPPQSFCVSPDNFFFVADQANSRVVIFKHSDESLRNVASLDNKYLKEKLFQRPLYCHYHTYKDNEYLGVLDFDARKIFIFKRTGIVEFKLQYSVDCYRLGFDFSFLGDVRTIFIPGYTTDENNNPFDLYSIEARTGKKSPILPSFKKYHLQTPKEYEQEYRTKKALPAIGLKAYIDISKNSLFYVWEGSPKIIKINLTPPMELTTFGEVTPFYKEPDAFTLSPLYRQRHFESLKELKKSMSYFRNIFSTSQHIFLIYDTDSKYRIQIYDLSGKFIDDMVLPLNPGRQMWFDKKKYILYAFSKESESSSEKFSILMYNINCR